MRMRSVSFGFSFESDTNLGLPSTLPPPALGRLNSGLLDQLLQFVQRLSIVRADRRIVASGVCPLQRTDHCARHLEWSATVVRFAHEVPLRLGLSMTAQTGP